MGTLPNQIVIENVLQCKMRGRVAYQSYFTSVDAFKLTYVKPYDDPSGKGYQRPVDKKRCKDFQRYLSQGEKALFTPILLNAAGNWEFISYDKVRQNYGRLICKDRASLMDGQHRLGGIKLYTQETNSEINIPFIAFHFLDEDEEIELFDTINTKAKGIGSSLSKYLRRDTDDLSWLATQLLIRPDSPFHKIGSIIGKRTNERHITLQNLYKTVLLLTKDIEEISISKEEKLQLAITYFQTIKEIYQSDWGNYKSSRITHTVCLDALSMVGSKIIYCCTYNNKIDYNLLTKTVKKLRKIDWSVNGPFKYAKGVTGSKSLAADLEKICL
jgi:DNA sulfur modification protein DndB